MPSHPVFNPNSVALITGGASGIGLAFAEFCHLHGMRIALVDISSTSLSSAVDSIRSSAHNAPNDDSLPGNTGLIRTYQMDVASASDWADLKVKVEMDFGLVSLLFLNAGIAPKSGWEDVVNFEKIMQTNYFGVVNGVAALLPSLRAQEPTKTSIIITGSKQGITNPPGNPAYNASKAAIKSFAESLSFDLKNSSTDVFLLVPGWTYTGLTRQALPPGHQEKPAGAWAPEQVIEYLATKMEEGPEQGFYVICPDNDVTEELDKNRILWTAGDIVEARPPLSRWREGWADEAKRKIETGSHGLVEG